MRRADRHLHIVPKPIEPPRIRVRIADGTIAAVPNTPRAVACDYVQFYSAILPERDLRLLAELAALLIRSREDEPGIDLSRVREILGHVRSTVALADDVFATTVGLSRVRVK